MHYETCVGGVCPTPKTEMPIPSEGQPSEIQVVK